MYEDIVMRAIANHIDDPKSIAVAEEGSWSGEIRILAYSSVNDMYAEGALSWGSCSYCNPWDGMTDDEIVERITPDIVTFTPEAVRSYLQSIVDKNRSDYYDGMAFLWATKALAQL
jgi:hypothetical protein